MAAKKGKGSRGRKAKNIIKRLNGEYQTFQFKPVKTGAAKNAKLFKEMKHGK